MKYIDWTLPSSAENLAVDEALLDLCEAGQSEEILRFWESQDLFVVMGYANHVGREVNLDACKAQKIPIYRRCSGGGTVLQGRGCLSYSLILKIPETGPLQSITGTNQFTMERNRTALASLTQGEVRIQGHTDLAVDNLKFSGNAQRRRRKFLIFHGTFLLQFELPLVEKYLLMPSQQPDYRRQRTHHEFLTNLNLTADAVKSALKESWMANEPAGDLSLANLPALVQKYSSDDWNFKF